MDRRDATRRRFLQLAGSLGLTLAVGPGCPGTRSPGPDPGPGAPSRTTRELGKAPPGPRAPDQTGRLAEDELDDLFRLFSYISETWQNRCTIDTRAALRTVADLKTGRRPSYLTEYRAAIARFRALRTERGEPAALEALFFEDDDPHLRHHVIAELLRLQIAFGGFRAFGYINHEGYMGGPFADHRQLPYQAWQSPGSPGTPGSQ